MRRTIMVGGLCFALGALAMAGYSLINALDRARKVSTASALPPDARQPAAREDDGAAVAGNRDTPWPPIFGIAPDPTPAPASSVTPPPASDPAEGYILKGLVTANETRWAIVTGPDGDLLVREGDKLNEGAIAYAIREDGVAVVDGDRTGIIRFSEKLPVDVVDVPREKPPESVSPTLPEKIQLQRVAPEELRDLILRANAARSASGNRRMGFPVKQ